MCIIIYFNNKYQEGGFTSYMEGQWKKYEVTTVNIQRNEVGYIKSLCSYSVKIIKL